MDEFGVLTERFGLKPQGKSAPMASSKRSNSNPGLNPNSSLNGSRSQQNSTFDFNFNSFPSSNKKPNANNVGSFDFVDDIFGGMPKKIVGVDDLLDKIGGLNANGAKSLNQKKAPDFDDLIPGFGGTTPSNHGSLEIFRNQLVQKLVGALS